MEKRQNFRKKVFERDNFTCKKCGFIDTTTEILEAHHIIPLAFDGEDEMGNIITLCKDCHHFAPNNKKEFEEYMKEEMTGTATILMKSLDKIRKENPELFDDAVFFKREK
jgi:5-methylcytosine-specific restriction endonuclease McrA